MSKKAWFRSLLILVILMISVGGFTRLTRSGLSMVEWRPITGILPPLSDEDWQKEFTLYQNSPEFKQVNSQFTLSDYQQIFYLEYLHRLLGRIIFLFAALPAFWFWRKRQIAGSLAASLTGLIAFQGLLGWLMVRSGLQNEPQVSPWFLAMHFLSALSVLLLIYCQLLKERPKILLFESNPKLKSILRISFSFLGVALFLQLVYGCLTAGFKAGFAFNTFPLMQGAFFPQGGDLLSPVWMNWLQNPATVQWTHRWLGVTYLVAVFILLIQVLRNANLKPLRGPLFHFMGVTFIQVGLGILNILWVVPTGLAALHQLMAVLVLLAYVNLVYRVQ